jgi:hypothetical protein
VVRQPTGDHCVFRVADRTSTGDQIDGVIKSAEVAWVASNGHPTEEAGDEHNRRVCDVGRGGGGAQLSRCAGAGGVEWVDDHTVRRHDTDEANLASRIAPGLDERPGRYVDFLRQLK